MSLEFCRLCLTAVDVECSIHEPARGEETCYELLSRILHPHELPDDGSDEWPTKICKECKRKTLDAYELYELCLSSGERIRQMFSVDCKRSLSPEVETVDCNATVEAELLLFVSDEQQDLQEDLNPMAFNEEPSNASPEPVEETQSHLQSEGYSCILCIGATFPSQSELSGHLKDHHGDQCDYCEPCRRAFLDREKYVAHKKCHDLGRTHFCTICEKGFRTAEAHRLHVLSHDAPFLCAECGKKFETKSNLKQHMKRHSNVRPFACKLCPSKFHSKGELKTHQYTHSKVKQFSCDMCGALFTKNSSLAKHQRIHTGIRPFSCEACSRSFYTSDLLKRHMLTHTGERPYKCTYCIRSFTQSNDLVKHMRTHIGTNIYKCDRCDASHRLLSELRDHYKVHYQSEEGKGSGSAESTAGEGGNRDFRFTTTNILKLHHTPKKCLRKE
ncbi:zinc finger protein 771-like [Anopheles aquasalis]|uniref:zinc finger protein 771-like n=1 Tax=Anopheles aquasalis TaxID=42839 RepID=UPI00215AA8D4|nr:zinc finger protein 771-like [Anopheles aquasalis]